MTSPLGEAAQANVLEQQRSAEQVQLQSAAHGWHWREDMERKLAAMEKNPELYPLGVAGDVLWYKRGKGAAAALGRDVDRPKPGNGVGPGGATAAVNSPGSADDDEGGSSSTSTSRRRRETGAGSAGRRGT